MIIKDLYGCKDTLFAAVPITIYGPTAGFSPSVNGTCYNSAITFTDTSTTDSHHAITQWIWSYGDTLQSYTAAPFIHSYTNPGIYSVGLTVVDSYGCRDSVSAPNLLTISKPVASFTLRDTTLCPATPLVISNKSTGLSLAQQWSFGDGNTSNVVTPVKSYSNEGNYTVVLNVTDRFGCTDRMTKNIQVFKANAGFTMSDSFSTCPPLLVDFTSKTNKFSNHGYDFGDGGLSTLLNPSHLYTYPGTYYVKRWAINNGGCTDTVIQKIVIQGPKGTFKYNPLVACNPSKVDFKATTENCVSYIWDYNDGTTIFSTQTVTSHTYSAPGIYLPKIILEDASGCRVPVTGL